MKKLVTVMTLGTLLATSHLYAGKNVVEAEEEIVAIPEHIDPNPLYLGIGALWSGVSRDCICYDLQGEVREEVRVEDSSWGGILRAGYDFNQYFGLEGRILKGSIGGDHFETTHYGIFLKPMMPVGEQANIYGLLGYGHTKIITDCGTLHEEFTHSGFTYGIGLEYDLSERDADKEEGEYDRPFDGHGDQEKGWGLWIDWQNLLHDEGPENYRANIVTFGVTYDF